MAPSAVEEPVSQTTNSDRILVKPWSRPAQTSEPLDWAPLTKIDLSRFDDPAGRQELAKQLYDAVTRVGFWVVVNTGLDDERVLRQFSIGNTFFKEPLEEKRRFPCNFAEGEYFGYRENSRWIGDTGIKENIEMVRVAFSLSLSLSLSLSVCVCVSLSLCLSVSLSLCLCFCLCFCLCLCPRLDFDSCSSYA
jgi:hypothetical protein